MKNGKTQDKAIRPARLLVGWLTEKSLASLLRPLQLTGAERANIFDHARKARSNVASRPPSNSEEAPVSSAPASLDDHLNKLGQFGDFRAMLSEGFHVALVDLDLLHAIQPQVFIDYSLENVDALDVGNLPALAQLTLPLASSAPISVRFDEASQTWSFASPSPNLRVFGRFNAELEQDTYGFGFSVGVAPSYLQVARFRGRLFLRDGYHRAYGLLARGVRRVPVIMRECRTDDEFQPPQGMLPTDVLVGDHAPRLIDFFDEAISATIPMPTTEKIVTIRAQELLRAKTL